MATDVAVNVLHWTQSHTGNFSSELRRLEKDETPRFARSLDSNTIECLFFRSSLASRCAILVLTRMAGTSPSLYRGVTTNARKRAAQQKP